jgi:2-keto-4-pentenoate hydratase/2-oxohepta-3-ene-1,7-dioic acid hydratase in catechol pathway
MTFQPQDASVSITPNIVSQPTGLSRQYANMYLVKEGGRPVPPLPTVFFKGSNSIAGHGDIVEIPKICQDDQADYEGELVVIIGKDAKNVSKEDALDYVLGYTAGDDVSSRYDILFTI